MWEGYRPKMLLYTLDELFYIYDRVKCHWGVDEKLVALHRMSRMGGKAWHARHRVVSEPE